MIVWSEVLSTIESFAIVIASISAVKGINSWRKEAKWKRKYELMEEVLALYYEAQDAIAMIRNPWSFGGEGKSKQRGEIEYSHDSEILEQANVVFERFEKYNDLFFKLKAVRYRFKAVFGKKSDLPFEELDEVVHDIKYAANRLGTKYWKEQGRKHFSDSEFESHLKEMHKFESHIWQGSSDPDEIRLRISAIIASVEKIAEVNFDR